MKNSYRLIALISFLFCLFKTSAQTTQTFTASGTFVVPCGVTTLTVKVWSAGGGGGGDGTNGGSNGAGGGGAGYSTGALAVTPGQSIAYVVGAGGAGGASNANGSAGGTSSFLTLTTTGGGGGAFNSGAVGTSGTGSSANGTAGGAAGGAGGGAGGTAGGAGGGTGGAGANGASGGAGNVPGGGGAGGDDEGGGTRNGGAGGGGQVEVTYTQTAPANDAVCSATTLLVNGTTLAAQTNCASTSLWSGGCVAVGETEVWYVLTVTGGNNTLTVNFPTNSFGGGNVGLQLVTNDVPCPANTGMTLWDDYCGTATGAITLSNLVAGTYYLGVSTTAGNQGSFTINATQSIVASFPDDPCQALTIASNYCSTNTAHTNVGATGTSFVNNFFNDNACGDNRENEIYFKFVATTTSVDITALQGSNAGSNAEITILQTGPDDNNCNDSYSVIASSCPAWGTIAAFQDVLTIGETYYVVIDHNGNNGDEGTFGLCLDPYNYVAPVGTGFTCGSAIPITTPFLDISTTVGAGNEWNFACGFYSFGGGVYEFGGTATEDKFYSLTVPAGGGYYDYSLTVRNTTLPVGLDFPNISFVTSCPGLNNYDFGSVVNSNTNNANLCAVMNDAGGDGKNSRASSYSYGGDIPCTGVWLPAGSYYIIIDHARNQSTTFNATTGVHNVAGNYAGVPLGYQYQFEINDLAQAPNNECTGVANIGLGVTQNGNNMGCNYSYGPNDPNSSDFCAISTENLAWFSFTTAPGQTTVGIDLTNVSGDVQWGVVQGPCGGPYTSAGANAANNPPDGLSAANDPCDRVSTATYNTTVTGLTANTQYWLIADGNAGTPSSFDITMTNITLPIDFSGFNLKNNLSQIDLDWSTASERDNDYFSIERSFDGVNWQEIGKVDGSGTTSTAKYYDFIDKDITTKGIRYYRIKQIDFNKNYMYSDTKSMFIDLTTVKLSPNPVVDELEIVVESAVNNSETKIEVYDLSGKLVYSDVILFKQGVNKLIVNTEKFMAGVYYVTVEGNNEIKNERFVKK